METLFFTSFLSLQLIRFKMFQKRVNCIFISKVKDA